MNERVGDAVQASHQPDILYLHALHFAKVPLKNITSSGDREEGFTPEQHIAISTFFNDDNPKEHALCILGS